MPSHHPHPCHFLHVCKRKGAQQVETCSPTACILPCTDMHKMARARLISKHHTFSLHLVQHSAPAPIYNQNLDSLTSPSPLPFLACLYKRGAEQVETRSATACRLPCIGEVPCALRPLLSAVGSPRPPHAVHYETQETEEARFDSDADRKLSVTTLLG